jgi:hypothetical protein
MANQTAKRPSAEERLSQVASHISGLNNVTQKHPDDIVVTSALRTAICKGGRGQFKDTAAVSVSESLPNTTTVPRMLIHFDVFPRPIFSMVLS